MPSATRAGARLAGTPARTARPGVESGPPGLTRQVWERGLETLVAAATAGYPPERWRQADDSGAASNATSWSPTTARAITRTADPRRATESSTQLRLGRGLGSLAQHDRVGAAPQSAGARQVQAASAMARPRWRVPRGRAGGPGAQAAGTPRPHPKAFQWREPASSEVSATCSGPLFARARASQRRGRVSGEAGGAGRPRAASGRPRTRNWERKWVRQRGGDQRCRGGGSVAAASTSAPGVGQVLERMPEGDRVARWQRRRGAWCGASRSVLPPRRRRWRRCSQQATVHLQGHTTS